MSSSDIKLDIRADCSNSPKKNMLKEFNIALVKRDMSFVSEQLADDIEWDIVGDKVIVGKDDFINTFLNKTTAPVIKLKLDQIITHGNVASANGYIDLENGKRFSFCHIYKFGSFKKEAKIKKCKSYIIEI